MPLLQLATTWLAYVAHWQNHTSEIELPIDEIKLAVIGTGIAASAFVSAWRQLNVPARVVVFEREAQVGGRLVSRTHRYGEFGALEGGASHFALDDTCVINLLHAVDLKHGAELPHMQLQRGEGFPDQAQRQLFCDLLTPDWTIIKDLTWKYGLSFWRARRLMHSAMSKWDAVHNLTMHSSQDASLADAIGQDMLLSAASAFTRSGISPAFQKEVLQPCSRSYSYKSAAEQSLLSALLSMKQIGGTAVVGGNVQIAERVFAGTDVDLLLQTEVTRITGGMSRRYRVQHKGLGQSLDYTEFDAVVMASPFTGSGVHLDLLEPIKSREVLHTDYEPRHITYVAAPGQLSSAEAYSYLDTCEWQDSILTSSDSAQHEIDVVGIRARCDVAGRCADSDWDTDCKARKCEDIYRIVSHHLLDDEYLIDLVEPRPGSHLWHARWSGARPNLTLVTAGIDWVYRFALPNALPKWQAQPLELGNVELAPGLLYTAGLERAVSSLETSCMAGRYAAHQLDNLVQSD